MDYGIYRYILYKTVHCVRTVYVLAMIEEAKGLEMNSRTAIKTGTTKRSLL